MGNSHFLNLYDNHKSGKLSRESYWSAIQDFLEDQSSFASLQELFGNQVSIRDGLVIVDIQATQSHDCRVLMALDPVDVRSVPFSVLADGHYESFASNILLELGKISQRFLDIGANMGFYSLALAIENPKLSVISFEPQPSVYQKMLQNIELNDIKDRIKPINMGLGQHLEELTMYVPRFTGTAGASFKNLHEDEGEATQIKVPVVTLDSIETGLVDLIKIDVEGAELNVISGAYGLIAQNRPTIMVELLRKWMKPFGHSPQMFLDKLVNFEYRCFAICHGSLSEIEQIDEGTEEKMFIFVHHNHHEHLDLILKYAN